MTKKLTNKEKSILGENYVKHYLACNGYTILDKKENGCDILAQKEGVITRIEVKTTSNLKGGIPDMHSTEFNFKNGKWYFVADYLYVVRLHKQGYPCELDILSREDIDKYADYHRVMTRIRTAGKLKVEIFKGKVGEKLTAERAYYKSRGIDIKK